jgi:hypothetical protein
LQPDTLPVLPLSLSFVVIEDSDPPCSLYDLICFHDPL